MPGAVASWPVTGTCFSLRGFSAEMTEFAEAVVGREHGVDLVAGLLEHLLEDRQRLLVVPVGHGLVRALAELAAAYSGFRTEL